MIVLRRRRQRVKIDQNWDMFYYKFYEDHGQPNLIWNFKCREELRECIEAEMRLFKMDVELSQGFEIAWNYNEFEVAYMCLSDEIKIGEYYLRLLLEQGGDLFENIAKELDKPAPPPPTPPSDATTTDQDGDGAASTEVTPPPPPPVKSVRVAAPPIAHLSQSNRIDISDAISFFYDLYHRFLLAGQMKLMCLQAMTIVYTQCHATIGSFHDTKYIVDMLDKTSDRAERDQLLVFIDALVLNAANIKSLLDHGGVRVLVDLATLAHLHTTRAYVPTHNNVIEASADTMSSAGDTEKEWYYGNGKNGPFSLREIKTFHADGTIEARTRMWAQGLDGWRSMDKIAQLKWTLLASGQAQMNETAECVLILNILIKMCRCYPSRNAHGAIIRPLPKIMRLLTDANTLPHIVQLLLTFDPIVVEKVATLLDMIVQDNPVLSKLYSTGVFFFISMYTGSNILPIGRFLKYTHLRQSFKSDDEANERRTFMSDIVHRSIVSYSIFKNKNKLSSD